MPTRISTEVVITVELSRIVMLIGEMGYISARLLHQNLPGKKVAEELGMMSNANSGKSIGSRRKCTKSVIPTSSKSSVLKIPSLIPILSPTSIQAKKLPARSLHLKLAPVLPPRGHMNVV